MKDRIYSTSLSNRNWVTFVFGAIGLAVLVYGWSVAGSQRWGWAGVGALLFLGSFLSLFRGGEWALRIDHQAIHWEVPAWNRKYQSGRVALAEVRRVWIDEGGIFSEVVLETTTGVKRIPGECMDSGPALRRWFAANHPEMLQEGPYA